MCRTLILATSILAAFPIAIHAAECLGGPPAGKLRLDRCAIVVPPDQASFVQYAVEDLAGYLKEATGNGIPIIGLRKAQSQTMILVGPAAEGVLEERLSPDKLGEEGHILRTIRRDGADYIIAAGATPRGTKAALAHLMRTIEVDGRSASVSVPLHVLGKPSFAKRGMHFNGWAFNYPYTFRNWREEDWQCYLDILAYQGVNLLYLWPFMEIMPVPLSPEDRAYLEECRRVVDYAQKKHGMEVWIMQCTNRVAKDRCGVADPRRRPYWRPSQEDLNPGNPQHFQAIMASREALYRTVNNVDGVCNIDSDPGYCPGSPLEDYLKVLQGCRALLDHHNLHGKQARLVHWMWFGWGLPPGRFFEPGHQALTLQAMRREIAEPWSLVAGRFEFLCLCRQQGVLDKTILLPYGVIEGEPSYPATNLNLDGIRTLADTHLVKCPDLAGVMGNVQTPLLQLPHVYFYTSVIRDIDYRKRPEREVLLELCGHLYPEHRQLLADGYLALRESEPARIKQLTDQLERLVREDRLGRLGIFGRKLFRDHGIVARALLLQLRLRAAQEKLVQEVGATSSRADCEKLIRDYFAAYLAWDTAHGWHGLWGWSQWPLGVFTSDPRFPAVCGKLRRSLGDRAAVDACFNDVGKTLSAKYDPRIVEEGCIAPLKKAVLAATPVVSLAQRARATASATPDPVRYPPGAANDGVLSTLYWPGALVESNAEWLQLTWEKPQRFDRVIARFLRHPSMGGRTIHLQRETAPGKWEDFATTVIQPDASAPHAVATFQLATPATLDKVRIVNLLDLFEVEVY